jgi:hypothetical protein
MAERELIPSMIRDTTGSNSEQDEYEKPKCGKVVMSFLNKTPNKPGTPPMTPLSVSEDFLHPTS